VAVVAADIVLEQTMLVLLEALEVVVQTALVEALVLQGKVMLEVLVRQTLNSLAVVVVVLEQ
jgi:hypothetical protein